MDKPKSSTKSNTPTPTSVFYVWYSELCRRLNLNPAPAVKPIRPRCQTVLDFVADRLKIEEWKPVLNALRLDTSLHVVAIRSRLGHCQLLSDETDEKSKLRKRNFGCIYTACVLKQLLTSLSQCVKITPVLTYLELDGLPLMIQYLEPLMQALKRNRTLRTLSLSNSSIQDSGCQLVCSYLRFTPNIEVLNLSGCKLSPQSGEHLAKLIKYQQINRYCETWHSSLRYESPDIGKMQGIKRVTINCNPLFGDAGLYSVLDELEDDLWIKALDLQKCGLTDNVSQRIFDIVRYNKTLEIIDVRLNDLMNMATMQKLFEVLKERQRFGTQQEFQWCTTAVSLTWSSASSIKLANYGVHKTRSVPLRTPSSKPSTILRKTSTVQSVQRNGVRCDSLDESKKEILGLKEKLQKEMMRRRQIEKHNEDLKQQLSVLRREKKPVPQALVVRRKEPSNKPKAVKNGHCKKQGNNNNNVYNILERLLNAGRPLDEQDEEEMLKCFMHPEESRKNYARGDSLSSSQVSLYRYMEELKTDTT